MKSVAFWDQTPRAVIRYNFIDVSEPSLMGDKQKGSKEGTDRKRTLQEEKPLTSHGRRL